MGTSCSTKPRRWRYLDRVCRTGLTPANATSAADGQVMNVNDWYLFHSVANVIVFQRVIGLS
jgi:hypothetical protein